MLWPASHLHPFRKVFAYFPMASRLLWVSDCFYMLQGWDFTKLFPNVMRAGVMRLDVRRAILSDTIHEAYKRFYILHLNTFWLKMLVTLQAPNFILFWQSSWYAITLVFYCLFLAGKCWRVQISTWSAIVPQVKGVWVWSQH